MSRKWQVNKAWENEHLVGPLAPVRWVLRAFSSIPLAVVLLVFISIYCALASVPIGLIALLPTYLIYAATVLVSAVVPAALGVVVVRRMVPKEARAARFAVTVLSAIGLMVAGAGAWARWVWPPLHYDPATGSGLLLFADFVATYKSVTLRRLPSMEMTETQFYAWWPMRLALILFVINMVVATVRRIEFNFKNIGVLSVHSGIVLIAVGSVFYQRFKQEGDTLVRAAATPDMIGPPQRSFYDREDTVLYVAQHRDVLGRFQYQQRAIKVPRYNNYGLNAGLPDGELFSERRNPARPDAEREQSPQEIAATTDAGRTLDIPVPDARLGQNQQQFVDPDVKFRVVGYSPYADAHSDWVNAEPPASGPANPMRTAELYAAIPGTNLPADRPVFEFPFFLRDPSQRVRISEFVAVEFTREMPEERWRDLASELPVGTQHGLVIEIPEQGFRTVVPVTEGQRLELGGTGWTVTVNDLAEEPPFPIITKGYEGATSSLAVVRIQAPAGEDGVVPEPVERWVYHRFPEINQDLSEQPDPQTGRPMRGAPDPRIRIAYIDSTRLQVYLDERADESVRAIVRQPDGQVRVEDRVADGWLRDLVPNDEGATIDLKLAERWAHAMRVSKPLPTPTADRDISMMGTHTFAMLAVEVSIGPDSPGGPWSTIVWLPFTKYLDVEPDKVRPVDLPDGRTVQIAFGRMQRPLPGFSVSLVDFEMIAYDHRGAPRDYQSVVRVAPTVDPNDPAGDFTPYEHLIKLNAPLRAPFHWDPEAVWVSNFVRRLGAGLNPNQLKFSHAGWDRQGWNQSQALVDQGVLPEPRVNFTILGVGNNPGIHVVAFGSILMGVGIPWAFYVKPWLVRREKRRLQEMVKSGQIVPPSRRAKQPLSPEVPA